MKRRKIMKQSSYKVFKALTGMNISANISLLESKTLKNSSILFQSKNKKIIAEINIEKSLEEIKEGLKNLTKDSEYDILPPYTIALIAIGENYEDIVKNWPKLFTMDADEIKEKYFSKVLSEIDKIIT